MTSNLKFSLRIIRLTLLSAIAVFVAGCGFLDTSESPMKLVHSLDFKAKSKWSEPFGIAYRNGAIYVSDGQEGLIYKIKDKQTSVFSKGLDTPSMIEFDDSGRLIVADSGDHTIKAIGDDGVAKVLAGVSGNPGFQDGNATEALFRGPIGIAVEGERIYVSDTYNDRIRIIENGRVSTIAGSERGFLDGNSVESRFDTPLGIEVKQGRLTVADFGNRRIRSIDKEGVVSTVAGGGMLEEGLLFDSFLDGPVDVSFDEKGRLFVTDGHRIRVFGARIVQMNEVLAGSNRGFDDGSFGKSRFNRPSGIVANNRSVYVADSENALVRVLTNGAVGKKQNRDGFYRNRPKIEEFKKKGPAKWPYDPPSRTREIAGTLGEIRGEISADSDQAWFHNGLDITGGFNEKARVIRDEKILLPQSVNAYESLRENIRFPQLGYVHISFGRDQNGTRFEDKRFLFDSRGLRVPRGTRFKSGEVLGTLNRMNHVHLIAGASGREWNALAALELPGASDSRLPVINGIWINDIEAGSNRIEVGRGKRLKVTAEIVDQMDGNAARRKLGIYKTGYLWESEGGKPNWTIIFHDSPDSEFVPLVYDLGSRSGATGTTTFRYIVSNLVQGSRVERNVIRTPDKSGEHELTIFAADFFGNVTSKTIEISVQ